MLRDAGMCHEMLGQAGTCQEVSRAAAGSERLALPTIPGARLSKGALAIPKHLEQNGVQKDRAKLPPWNK